MKINAYFAFDGNCEEAMNFYKEILNGEIIFIQRYKDGPVESSEEYKNKILHASLSFDDQVIYFSDMFEGQKVTNGNRISLNLEFGDEEKQEAFYKKLSEEGDIRMPLQDTFWGAKYGSVVDKFGIHWGLNCAKKQ